MSSQTRLTFLLQWKKTYSGKMCFLTIQQKSVLFAVFAVLFWTPLTFYCVDEKNKKQTVFPKSRQFFCVLLKKESPKGLECK